MEVFGEKLVIRILKMIKGGIYFWCGGEDYEVEIYLLYIVWFCNE